MNHFNYPKHGYGFHSGWDDSIMDVVFSKRREIALSPIPHKELIIFKSFPIPPLLLKQYGGAGKVKGLSSGMGGALVPFQGNIIKIKRCGYQNKEFVRKKWYNLKIRAGKNSLVSIIESEDYLGVLSLASAKREIDFINFLKDNDFPIFQDPVALYKFQLFTKKRVYCSLLFSVVSDFRCDELVHKLLFNLWSEGIKKGLLILRNDSQSIVEKTNRISDVLDLIHELNYDKVLFYLGTEIGKKLRYIHDLKALRGFNNSWLGNVIITAEGQIGFCDFDDSVLPGECSVRELKMMQEIEFDEDIEMIYNTIGTFRRIFAKLICRLYCRAFTEGYRKEKSEDLPSSVIREIMSEGFLTKNPFGRFDENLLDIMHGHH